MNVNNLVVAYGQYTVYAILAFAFMFVAKILVDLFTPFSDEREISGNSNLALAFRKGGFSLAVAIGLAGALSGPSLGFGADLKLLVVDGIILVVALLVAFILNDKCLLRLINNNVQVGPSCRNIAVGVSEFGSLVGTGLIMNGAFSGAGGGYTSIFVFLVLGQIALILLTYLYELITPYHVVNQIRDGNVSAGVGLAGMLISFGIILRGSIAGDSTGLFNDLIGFGVSMIYGIVILLVFIWVVDRVFLPSTRLSTEVERDHNTAALFLAHSTIAAVAVMLSSLV